VQHRNARKLQHRTASKATPHRAPPAVDEHTEVTRLTRELNEALEQQAVASELLGIISSGAAELETTFHAILEKATRLCKAEFGNIYRWDGDALYLAAAHNVSPAFEELRRRSPFRPKSDTPIGQMIATKKVAHVADLRKQRGYVEKTDNDLIAGIETSGMRTLLSVPMLKDGELLGGLSIYRLEVRSFTERQIALVSNFAAQAVIAIENARLLNELRQSLEQQTATSQVLQVISNSPGALHTVFATMLENAVRICAGNFGTLYLREDDGFRAAVMHNAPPAYQEARSEIVKPHPITTLRRAANTKQPVQIADVTLERGYIDRDPFVVSAVDLGGYRSVLSVPMLHEDTLAGVITIFRQEVREFTKEQVSLLEDFAAQAVIAIENARLLKELRERTQEVEKLNQHLEQRVVDQVDEIERMSRLRRFLPPQVADLIVASGSEKQLESHRREITALFCDLRGFTGFTESADAEDVMALLRDYHAAIGETIIKYNGTLERYAGDGVMVVFNDPVLIENPALQAVLMALELREALGKLTGKWRRFGHDVGFGIGIAHGYATLGTIGFEGRFDYAAIGTVSNVASRLCDEAKPGQILISPRVLVAVEDDVQVEPVGEFELKGIRRPLAAYNVLGVV
jgi:class 3 adenylate cyclase/putative methionine-R-sulfoxide reductase with GAF domain